jgi:MinD-like ATPase involved in chromosome partitioning or flagellar assembly
MTQNRKIVGFFGYKGGLGRTVCAAATATLLAEQGRRVLLVDGDLEAPGLSLSAAYEDVLMDRPGLIQLLSGEIGPEAALSDAPALTTTKFTRAPALSGSLRLLGAGTRRAVDGRGINTEAFIFAMDTLSTSASQPSGAERVMKRWGAFIEQLHNADDVDVVILDMRTGFSQFTGMMMSSCDVAVFMCGLNQQNILGTASILRGLEDGAPKHVLLVASPVPGSATRGLEEAWRLYDEVLGVIKVNGESVTDIGHQRLSLPYSPILAVSDDPKKYINDEDLRPSLAEITNTIRSSLRVGVSHLLSELGAQMVGPDTEETTSTMCRLLVELARINGLQDTLAREGHVWHMGSVPVNLARALADTVDVLKKLGEEISDDLVLDVAKLWVYKLRFSRPSTDAERVLALFEGLIYRVDVEGWRPRDRGVEPVRLIGRMRVDYADAIVHHQRHRVVNLGEAVDLEALNLAERELRQLRIDLVGPGTLIWCARVISHLIRLIPERLLMEHVEAGVTRVQSLADFAEDLFDRSKGAPGHKIWSEYVTVGLAIAWPQEDAEQQRRRVNQAITLTEAGVRYSEPERGPLAASYDRAILYYRLGDLDKAHKALELLQGNERLRAFALIDPDLQPLRGYMEQNFVSQRSATHG